MVLLFQMDPEHRIEGAGLPGFVDSRAEPVEIG